MEQHFYRNKGKHSSRRENLKNIRIHGVIMTYEETGSKINEDLQKLVAFRIETLLPPNLKLSVGSYGSFSKEELIEHIQKGDEIGQAIMESHRSFMKALMSGEFTDALVSAVQE